MGKYIVMQEGIVRRNIEIEATSEDDALEKASKQQGGWDVKDKDINSIYQEIYNKEEEGEN